MALTIRLVNDPVPDCWPRDVDDPIEADPELLEASPDVGWEIVAAPGHDANLWLPQPSRERRVKTISTDRRHVRRAIWHDDVVEREIPDDNNTRDAPPALAGGHPSRGTPAHQSGVTRAAGACTRSRGRSRGAG